MAAASDVSALNVRIMSRQLKRRRDNSLILTY